MLTRESILASNDRPLQPVEVPEWGGTVYVPKLSLTEAASFSKLTDDQKGGGVLAARIIVDAAGKRIFTDEDAPKLADKSAVAIGRVIEAFTQANSVNAKAIEAAAKN
jgi:hypothetical protein